VTTRIATTSRALALIGNFQFLSASFGPVRGAENLDQRNSGPWPAAPCTPGGAMFDRRYTLAQETVVISAFRGGVAVDVIAEAVGKTRESVEDLLARIGLTSSVAENLDDQEDPELSQAAVAERCRNDDLAFQKAMRRAIKRGLEHPPMVGTFKDETLPTHYHQYFVPNQPHSGCSSPAQECAELCSPFD